MAELTKEQAYDQIADVVHAYDGQTPVPPDPPADVVVADGASLQAALNANASARSFLVMGRRQERVRVDRPGVAIAFDETDDDAGIDGVDNQPTIGIYASDVTVRRGTLRPGGSADRCTMVEIGTYDATDPTAQPRNVLVEDLIVDGLYRTKHAYAIHGGCRVNRTTVIGVGLDGVETHGVWILNSPGDITVENSHIEAAAIGVFCGGDTFRIGQVPVGILIRNNTIYKPDEWRSKPYVVKCGVEFKGGRQITIEHNEIDGNWADGQDGDVMNLKAESQYGADPFVDLRDVIVRLNIIRRTSGGISIGGPMNYPHQGVHNITIDRNTCTIDKNIVGDRNQAGSGRGLQIQGPIPNLHVLGNVFDGNGSSWSYTTGAQLTGARFEGNTANHGSYGFTGDNVSPKSSAVDCLSRYFPGAVWMNNTIRVQEGKTYTYPPGTTIVPATRGARRRHREITRRDVANFLRENRWYF
jgi:hypothetical protein